MQDKNKKTIKVVLSAFVVALAFNLLLLVSLPLYFGIGALALLVPIGILFEESEVLEKLENPTPSKAFNSFLSWLLPVIWFALVIGLMIAWSKFGAFLLVRVI